jgi:AraC-like DNA-binding protein
MAGNESSASNDCIKTTKGDLVGSILADMDSIMSDTSKSVDIAKPAKPASADNSSTKSNAANSQNHNNKNGGHDRDRVKKDSTTLKHKNSDKNKESQSTASTAGQSRSRGHEKSTKTTAKKPNVEELASELSVIKTELKQLNKAVTGLTPFLQEMRDFKDNMEAKNEEGEVTDDESDHDMESEDDSYAPVENDSASGSGACQILEDLVSDLNDAEVCGPAVMTKLAGIVNCVCKRGLTYDKVEARSKNFVRPENCDGLVVPRVNTDIWKDLRTEMRNKDRSVQKVLAVLIKGIIPVVSATNKLLVRVQGNEEDKEAQDLLHGLMNGVALLGTSVHELNMVRRDIIKPALNNNYAQALTSPDNQITQWLFGDDPNKVCKDTGENKRLTKGSGPTSHRGKNTHRFKPYGQRGQANNNHNRVGFLDRNQNYNPAHRNGNQRGNNRKQQGRNYSRK